MKVSNSQPWFHGNHWTVGTARKCLQNGWYSFETVSRDGFSLRSSQHVGTQTDDTAWRHVKFNVWQRSPEFPWIPFHLYGGYHINHLAGKFFRARWWSVLQSVRTSHRRFPEDNLRLSYLKFVAFTTHGFNPRPDKWSTRPETIHFPSSFSVLRTRSAGVLVQLFHQTVVMWREVTYFPSLPKNGESLMVNSMLMVGSSMAIGGSGSGFEVADGITDFEAFHTDDGTNVARRYRFYSCGPDLRRYVLPFDFDFTNVPSRLARWCSCLLSAYLCARPTAIRPV